MKTKNDFIAECKAANPKMVQTVNGESRELTSEEYEEACANWADMQMLAQEYAAAKLLEDETKAIAQAKLAALGLTTDDLKALGL